MNAPIAVGRQVGNGRLDRRHQIVVRYRRPADPPLRPLLQALNQVVTTARRSGSPSLSTAAIVKP
jgi:hypothetical protein